MSLSPDDYAKKAELTVADCCRCAFEKNKTIGFAFGIAFKDFGLPDKTMEADLLECTLSSNAMIQGSEGFSAEEKQNSARVAKDSLLKFAEKTLGFMAIEREVDAYMKSLPKGELREYKHKCIQRKDGVDVEVVSMLKEVDLD